MWYDDDKDFTHDESQDTLPTWQMLRRVHPYVRPRLGAFLAAFALALVGVAMILGQPLIFKRIVDVDFPARDIGRLMRSSLAYLGLLVGGGLANGAATVILGRSGVEIVNSIKQDLFDKALSLGLPWIEKHPTGTLVSRIETDSQRLVNLTSTMAMRMLSAFVMIGGAVVVVAGTDLRLLVVAASFLPLMVAGTLLIFKRLRKRFREERRLYAGISADVAEFVPAARLLQALGRSRWALGRLGARNRGYARFSLRLFLTEYGAWHALGFLELGMTVAALWLGAGWVADGSLTAGTLVMFAQYAAMIYWPVLELSEQLAEIQRAGGAADRIFTLLSTEPAVPAPARPKPLPERPGRIAFEGVTFGYDPAKPVLHDFHLEIAPGETVALVGPTGGGKSTILGLATRLRDPDRGRVTLDGVDAREFDPREWRRLFGLVLQDLYLFPASVVDNLRAFRGEIPPERVRAAARIAGIDEELLRRPGGFDGELAERGAGLSYGQRQLLALARALTVDPPVLVLDEATSSVDPRTERRIQRTLDELTRGRTTIVVAHRLSTVRHADRILVIEDGRVVEQGRHDELLAAGGAYAALLATQQAGLVDDEPAGAAPLRRAAAIPEEKR